MSREKYRIRFRKAGDLRFLSHHDLMRLFERMLRRAALPFHSSEGFHPKPRMAFASALALGIVGQQEVIEIEFDGPLSPDDIHARLAGQSPAGLEIVSVRAIDPKRSAQVRRAVYCIELLGETPADLNARIAATLAAAELWVERIRPQPRKVNIRPYLRDVQVAEGRLLMDLAITPNGAAKPEEILEALGLSRLLAEGGVLERTLLELHDESQVSSAEPDGEFEPASAAPLDGDVEEPQLAAQAYARDVDN